MISQRRPSGEMKAWREVENGWRPRVGDVEQFGVGVEWHDFRTERSFDWGQSFHPRSVEFCLNLVGCGEVAQSSRIKRDYLPGTSGYYSIADEPLAATREANQRHQFVPLEFSRPHLQKKLEHCEADLDACMRNAVFGERGVAVSAPSPITAEQRNVVGS